MAASDDVKKLQELIDDPAVKSGGKARYKNKSYSLSQLNELLKTAQKVAKQEAETRMVESGRQFEKQGNLEIKTAAEKAKAKEELVNARIDLQVKIADLDLALENNGDVPKAQKTVRDAYIKLQNLNPKDELLKGVTISSVSRGGREREGGVSAVKPAGTTTTTTGSTATTGTGTVAPVTTTVTPSTAPTGATVTTTKGKTTPKTPVAVQQNWIDALQQFFPSYSDDWLAANAEAYFGKDLIDLMIKVSDPRGTYDLSSTAGRDRIKQEIRGTNYWTTTESEIKAFDQLLDIDQKNLITQTKSRIANTYGDIGLDDATLTEVASTVARRGLTGLGEKQAVFNATFNASKNQAQTGRALSGADADRIRKIGRAYNFKVTDDQVQSILTGTPEATTGQVLTEEGLRQRLQKFARGAYPQLADQIDAGLSLEDVGANYRRYAADLLERSEDEIDMFSGPYLKAFGTKDGGQLSLSDWVTTVKSDPTFGWQYTKQANQQATDIALSLARAFGKVG
jgi:hypothetical protein